MACARSDTCGHAKSTAEIVYDFRNVCKNESMYFEWFEGDFRTVEKEKKVEETNSAECESENEVKNEQS